MQTKTPNIHQQLSNKPQTFAASNQLTTISNRKQEVSNGNGGIAYYTADIISSSDYYPFGFAMDGRDYESNNYRYGFNGMEKDNEFTNSTSHYDFKFRFYDSRIGRFFSVDPLSYALPYNSSYCFAENDVIRSIDLEGLEKYIVTVIEESDDYVILKVTLSSETVSDQRTVHGAQASFDNGKTYSTNFKYKALQEYYRRTKMTSSGTVYYVPTDGEEPKQISQNGGRNFSHPSGSDAPTYSPPAFKIINIKTEPRLVHVNLAPMQDRQEHLHGDGPSYTTTKKYNTGNSSTKSLVSINYDLMDEENTIEIVDSKGNVIASNTGSGTGVLKVELESNTDFSVRVKPKTQGSQTDGWTYDVSITNTKSKTVYDEEDYEAP